MSLQRPIDENFVLGIWTVNPKLNSLFKINSPSKRVSLEPRLMHLLCFLAANQGTVLSREQLIAELWPRVIVNENSLTRAVSELRKKLNSDQNHDVNYLETIPKKGYLLNSVQVGYSPEEQSGALSDKASKGKSPGRFLAAWQPALIAASVVFAMALSISPTRLSESPAIKADSEILIADQIVEFNESYSPLRANLELVSARNQVLADSASEFVPPLISRDGKKLAYLRYDNNGSSIFLSGVDSVAEPVAIYSSDGLLYNLSWSPVGDALLFALKPIKLTTAMLDSSDEPADLMMLNLKTFEVTVLIDSNPVTPKVNAEHEINLT